MLTNLFDRYERVKPTRKGCGKCGSKTVTWFQSERTEKWYLAEVFVIDSEFRASRSDLHSKFCSGDLDHDDEQRKLDHMARDAEARERELREQQEQAADEKSAENFMVLIPLSREEKLHKLEMLEREMDGFFRNPPTMDYMTEFNREIAAQKIRQAQWKFLKALTGAPTEDDYTWKPKAKGKKK